MLSHSSSLQILRRPRRNRKSKAIRHLVQETYLHPSDLIYPQFVIEGRGIKEPVKSMPGVHRLSIDLLLKEIEQIVALGIPAVVLFPIIPRELRNSNGSEASNSLGILQQAIRAIKRAFPQLCLISDVALDPYTSHGHDGLVDEKGEILNDETIQLLIDMALVQAEAGVDIVAPSDMMDGRIQAIRQSLDEQGFQQVSILSYTAKYASAFYGPFREALASQPLFGDKKSYQMNPANSREAILEATLDEIEGADILMVKPALPYLDVIAQIRSATSLPIAAYQVSGEYSMIMAADQKGWIEGEKALLESLLCIKRAGCEMIITYAAPLAARAYHQL